MPHNNVPFIKQKERKKEKKELVHQSLSHDQPCVRASFSLDWMGSDGKSVILWASKQNSLSLCFESLLLPPLCMMLVGHPDTSAVQTTRLWWSILTLLLYKQHVFDGASWHFYCTNNTSLMEHPDTSTVQTTRLWWSILTLLLYKQHVFDGASWHFYCTNNTSLMEHPDTSTVQTTRLWWSILTLLLYKQHVFDGASWHFYSTNVFAGSTMPRSRLWCCGEGPIDA